MLKGCPTSADPTCCNRTKLHISVVLELAVLTPPNILLYLVF